MRLNRKVLGLIILRNAAGSCNLTFLSINKKVKQFLQFIVNTLITRDDSFPSSDQLNKGKDWIVIIELISTLSQTVDVNIKTENNILSSTASPYFLGLSSEYDGELISRIILDIEKQYSHSLHFIFHHPAVSGLQKTRQQKQIFCRLMFVDDKIFL